MGAASQDPAPAHCQIHCCIIKMRVEIFTVYIGSLSTCVEKTGPGNFLPYAFVMTIGRSKRPFIYNQTNSIWIDYPSTVHAHA